MAEKKLYLKMLVNVTRLSRILPDESVGCIATHLETESRKPLAVLKKEDFTCPVSRNCTLLCFLNPQKEAPKVAEKIN